MGFEVAAGSPAQLQAVYYLVLPDEFKVLWANDLSMNGALEYVGEFTQFLTMQTYGTPMIPLDTHHALLLNWVDMDRMSRNRPYLDDAIKAAVALVA